MSKQSQSKPEFGSPMTRDIDTEESELWKAFQNSKPIFTSKAAAQVAVLAQLEKLANAHELSVSELIAQSHSTNDSQAHHIEAVHLERQLAHLSRR